MKKETEIIKEKEIVKEEAIKKQQKSSKKVAKKRGFSLGCLIGMHAYVNGRCMYCGKKL
jgi:hypothetical protein